MVNVYEIRPGSYATVAEAKKGGSESDVTKEYVDAGLAEKQDVLTAGANITIVENVISATGELASTEWGEIGGSMSNQTDLVNALEGKASASDVAGLTTRVGNAESAIAGLDASKASKTELSAVEAEIPDVSGLATKTEVTTGLAGKQDTLVSGTNIKTINGTSVLGSGDVSIEGVPDTTGASSGDVLTFDGTDVGWAAGGGSAPTNMVTTDTAQTITGTKTMQYLKFGTNYAGTFRDLIEITPNDFTSPPTTASIYFNDYTNNTRKGCLRSRPGSIELVCSTKIGDYQHSISVVPSSANSAFGVKRVYSYSGDYNGYIADDPTNAEFNNIGTVRNSYLVSRYWLSTRMPEFTITGDGTTTAFTVAHSLGKMPGIVQVTDSNGVVIKDSEITITKTTTDVNIVFTTAPAADATYTVAMLY